MVFILLTGVALYLVVGGLAAVVWWPLSPSFSLVFIAAAIGYPVFAWFNADRLVAEKAGFHKPTLVQQRYVEYLGLGIEVWTHPSLLVVAGVLASYRRKIILLSAGALRDLSDEDIRLLVDQFVRRDHRAVFKWTYHLATGGLSLFSVKAANDYSISWIRLVLYSSVLLAIMVLFTVVSFASVLAAYKGTVIPIDLVFPGLALPLAFPVLIRAWRLLNKGFVRLTGSWNSPIELSGVTLSPVGRAAEFDPRLNVLRHGLLWAKIRANNQGVTAKRKTRIIPK